MAWTCVFGHTHPESTAQLTESNVGTLWSKWCDFSEAANLRVVELSVVLVALPPEHDCTMRSARLMRDSSNGDETVVRRLDEHATNGDAGIDKCPGAHGFTSSSSNTV